MTPSTESGKALLRRAQPKRTNYGVCLPFGIVVPQGMHVLLREVPAILSDEENGLLASMRELFTRLLAHVKELDQHVTELEEQIT
jgi:transposase